MSWWYKKLGDATHYDWPAGTDLPTGADWSHVDFLNQFIEQGNRRHGLRYAINSGNNAPDTGNLVAAGTDVQAVSFWEWLANRCANYSAPSGRPTALCLDGTTLPADGAQPAEKAAFAGTLSAGDPIPPYIRLLKDYIQSCVLFCGFYDSTYGLLTGGTRTEHYFEWNTPGARYVWAEMTPNGSTPTMPLDEFGSFYNDDPGTFWGIYRSREVRAWVSVENPEVNLLDPGIDINAQVGLYYRLRGEDAAPTYMGFDYPTPGAIALAAQQEFSLNGGDTLIASGLFGPSDVFRAYSPTGPTGSARARALFQLYGLLSDP